MTTETTTKPRWVECADKASEVLDTANTIREPVEKDATLREAHAWMQLACIYRDGHERKLDS